jgi:peptidoglycan/LPS O-acetylase OafA/YrhL
MTTFDEPSNRNRSLGYLRTFLTLLVVAHHAALAYHPYAPPPATTLNGSLIWAAFPIVDVQRLPGLDVFVALNDTFFMSLMFFVSGVFAWGSLRRKGSLAYLRDRTLRLGVPFVVAAGLLAPLAYYPTYLAERAPVGSFWHQWLAIDGWPAGPAWFLWVLLAFGVVAAALFSVAPRFGDRLGALTARLSSRPIVYFVVFVVLSAIAYLPMAATFDPLRWISAGPFYVQISRLLNYAFYFFAGIGVGANGLERGLLARDGKLARRWALWLVGGLFAFATLIGCVLAILAALQKAGPSPSLVVFANFAFVLTCATLSLACMALFVRYTRSGNRVMNSLSANAYGIYLLHYACVSWLQFALLQTRLPAAAKFGIVVVGAITASWLATAVLRRIPAIARIIGSAAGVGAGARVLSS